MTREILNLELAQEQLADSEDLGESRPSPFKAIGARLLDDVFESDKGVQTLGSREEGGYDYEQPLTFDANNKINVCSPTAFPAEIIKSATGALAGFSRIRYSVIDTGDVKSAEQAGRILNPSQLSEETFIFVNWNEKDESESANVRREKIAQALFSTSVSAPAHIVVVPNDQPAILQSVPQNPAQHEERAEAAAV